MIEDVMSAELFPYLDLPKAATILLMEFANIQRII